jgi:glycerol-3-phosphate dehydrogenase
MLNEIEKERFNNKVCAKVRISADIFVSSLMTESAAEVDIVVPDTESQVLLDLYVRICKFINPR